MIIVSITGPTMHDALNQIEASRRYADMIELRLDLIMMPNVGELIGLARLPAIVTCRPEWEGGNYRGDEEQRAMILASGSALGASYVDVEWGMPKKLRDEFLSRQRDVPVIMSRHLWTPREFSVKKEFEQLHRTGASVIKFAYTATDAWQTSSAFDFLELARSRGQKAVAIAMGESGEASRVLYKKFGGWGTYAGTEDGKTAAPGQISARVLKEVYHAEEITKSTKVFGVIGNPVRHSKGIFVHNPLLRKAGKNSVYCRFQVADVRRFVKNIAPRMQGFSVTMPHKEAIVRYLDGVDPTAAALGVVNTVIRRGKRLLGTNTDAPGALDAIEKTGRVQKKTLLVIGAGGAARAIAYEAAKRKAIVLITNRTSAKAERLARQLGVASVPFEALNGTKVDILVNATSVGMAPQVDDVPIPGSAVRARVVFDAVYNPPMTRFLSLAAGRGSRTVSGTEMYLNQAARQSKLFTGVSPSLALMRKLLFEHLA